MVRLQQYLEEVLSVVYTEGLNSTMVRLQHFIMFIAILDYIGLNSTMVRLQLYVKGNNDKFFI